MWQFDRAGTVVRGAGSRALDQANGPSGDQWRAAWTDPFAAPSVLDSNGLDASALSAPSLNFVEQARSSPELSGIVVAQGPGARERAQIAQDVYRDVATPPGGYRVASEGDLGRLGLRPQDLSAIDTQFGARVYVRQAGGSADVVVAFREQQAGRHVLNLLRANRTSCTITAVSGLPVEKSATTPLTAAAATRTGTGRAARVAAFNLTGEILSTLQDGGLRFQSALFGRGAAARNV